MRSRRWIVGAATVTLAMAGAAQANTWFDDFTNWTGQDNSAVSSYTDINGLNPGQWGPPGGVPVGGLTQEAGTIAKFYDPPGGGNTRWRFSTDLPSSMDGNGGVGWAFKMKVADYSIARGPIQMIVTDTGQKPGTGYGIYMRTVNAQDLVITRNGGAQFADIDTLTLPGSIADEWHVWTVTLKVQSDTFGYWNVWLDSTDGTDGKLMFSGVDGSPTGPDDGEPYSFRTWAGDGNDRMYTGLGDLGWNTYHDFQFDWIGYKDDGNAWFVPEPASLTLLTLGGCLLFRRRRTT